MLLFLGVLISGVGAGVMWARHRRAHEAALWAAAMDPLP